jgi:hypothetical protein
MGAELVRNPRPIVARCVRGPLAGKTFRVKDRQGQMVHYGDDGRAHLYQIVWPRDEAAVVLELLAHYKGTRKR